MIHLIIISRVCQLILVSLILEVTDWLKFRQISILLQQFLLTPISSFTVIIPLPWLLIRILSSLQQPQFSILTPYNINTINSSKLNNNNNTTFSYLNRYKLHWDALQHTKQQRIMKHLLLPKAISIRKKLLQLWLTTIMLLSTQKCVLWIKRNNSS